MTTRFAPASRQSLVTIYTASGDVVVAHSGGFAKPMFGLMRTRLPGFTNWEIPPIFSNNFGIITDAFPLPTTTVLFAGRSAKAFPAIAGMESAAAPAAAVFKKSLLVDIIILLINSKFSTLWQISP